MSAGRLLRLIGRVAHEALLVAAEGKLSKRLGSYGAEHLREEILRQAEAVRKFEVLPDDWTEESGHLTPSLKLKRGLLMRDLREHVERLYSA